MGQGNEEVNVEVEKKADDVNGVSAVDGNGGKANPEAAETEVKVQEGSPRQGLRAGRETKLSWKDLSFTVSSKKETKVILQPTSGEVESRRLLAIMGPSGSGKTTLLSSLASRVPKANVGGSILFNGQKVSDRTRRKIMSYVAQEDTLLGILTVRETLDFAVQFQYGLNIKRDEKHKHVQRALEDMGLVSCADVVIGDIFRKGISGGQKRRLSIALEMISDPAVLLLDEPKSGLDSASAFGVMKVLNMLADQGRTIVTTIHQPSSEVWSLFDKFMLLSKGHTIYFGNARDALAYFACIGYTCPNYSNPADFLVSLVNTDFTGLYGMDVDLDVLVGKYHELVESRRNQYNGRNTEALALEGTEYEEDMEMSMVKGSHDKDMSKRFLGGRWDQFCILMKRNLLNNIRNPGIYWVRLVMYMMLSLMIGFLYWDLGSKKNDIDITSRFNVLFFVMAFLVFMSVAVLPFFIIDRATFIRERSNGVYSISPYVAANFFSSLPGLFLIALISSICIVFPANLNNFGYYLATLFLSLVVAESIMALIASCVNHYIIGIALGAGLFGANMLVMGFFIIKSAMPVYFEWAWYLAFHSYAFRVFMVNEFESIESFNSTQFPDGNSVLRFYEMEGVDRGVNLSYLLIFIAAYQLLYTIVLYTLYTY